MFSRLLRCINQCAHLATKGIIDRDPHPGGTPYSVSYLRGINTGVRSVLSEHPPEFPRLRIDRLGAGASGRRQSEDVLQYNTHEVHTPLVYTLIETGRRAGCNAATVPKLVVDTGREIEVHKGTLAHSLILGVYHLIGGRTYRRVQQSHKALGCVVCERRVDHRNIGHVL